MEKKEKNNRSEFNAISQFHNANVQDCMGDTLPMNAYFSFIVTEMSREYRA